MCSASEDRSLEACLSEYEQLKSEQTARIGFRDNLIYVTLALAGGLFSFSVAKDGDHIALLIVPFVTFVLGWTYVMNDDRISAISDYLRTEARPRLETLTASADGAILGWEVFTRRELRRARRKVVQVIVNELVFVGSGVGALAIFWSASGAAPGVGAFIATFAGAFLLVFLAVTIVMYGDIDVAM